MKKVLLGVICIFIVLAFTHPLKMSICEIRMDTNGDTELSFRFFEDDFQAQLRRFGERPSLDLFSQNPIDKEVLESYVKKHFSLSQERKRINYDIISYEFLETDLVIVVKAKAKLLTDKQLFVENTLMTDIFSNQQNLVFFFQGDAKKTVMELDAEKTIDTFKLP